MTTPTLLPEIEAAIADAGQALVDAWDSAQGGPPHRFAVYVDPEGDPEVAAGWMAMARFHAWAIAAAEQRGYSEGRAGAIAECKAAGALYVLPDAEDVIEAFRAATWSEALCSLHSDGAPVQVVQAAIDAAENLRAIAADKAALDATWRAHDLERDAEVAQAQAATHEACAALQAICAALHVTPSTGSTYCTEAVAMVLERVAADKARAVEAAADAAFDRGRAATVKYADGLGLRPALSQADADALIGAYGTAVDKLAGFAAEPPTSRNHYKTQLDALYKRHADARAALLAALTGAGGGR